MMAAMNSHQQIAGYFEQARRLFLCFAIKTNHVELFVLNFLIFPRLIIYLIYCIRPIAPIAPLIASLSTPSPSPSLLPYLPASHPLTRRQLHFTRLVLPRMEAAPNAQAECAAEKRAALARVESIIQRGTQVCVPTIARSCDSLS
jgi:hypothetical protein